MILLLFCAAPPIPADAHGDPLPRGAIARYGTVRLRHGHTIAGVAFSSDGKKLMSWAADHTVRLWDVKTGREVGCLGREEAPANVFKQSRWIMRAALSPDGQRIAALANDASLSLWDTESGKRRVVPQHIRSFGSLDFSPDGKRLLAAAYGSVHLLDGEGRIVQTHGAGPSAATAAAYSPDGKSFAAVGRVGAILWDAASGERRMTAERSILTALAWSADGKRLVVGGQDGRVVLLDAKTGKQAWSDAAGKQALRLVAFIKGGKEILAQAVGDAPLRILDAGSGKELRRIALPFGYVSHCAFSPDGKSAALASPMGHSLRMLDLETGKPFPSPPGHDGHIRHLAFDGDAVVTGSEDGTARAWGKGTSTGIAGKGTVVALRGKKIALRAFGGKLECWETSGTKPLLTFDMATELVRCAAFDPEATRLVAGCVRGVIRVFDAATGKLVRDWKGGEPADVSSIAFGPDGIIAASSSNGRIALWAESGEKVRDLAPTPGQPFHLVFSRDGRYLAAGGTDSRARVWEVASGEKVREFGGLRGYAMSVAFSPDGRRLAVGEWMGTSMFALSSALNLGRAEGQNGDVMALGFSPDGKRVVAGSGDGTALVWDAERAFQPGPLGVAAPTEIAVAVGQLEGEAARAVAAIWSLASTGDKVVEELKTRLRPVAMPDLKLVPGFLAKLDDEGLEERRKAMAALEDMGHTAEKALREALRKADDPDVKLRLGLILRRLAPGESGGSDLRDSRAMQVLELVNTPASRRLLEELAKGAPDAPRTKRAKAAVARLK